MANSPHPSQRLLNPVPQTPMGRTDQGVDWGSITGDIQAVAGGVITNVYRGIQGFGTTIIEKLSGSNTEVYYALETGGTPDVQAGQTVAPGQSVATGLGTGGIEVGYWDPSTGRAVGASQGYTEGVPTPAGQSFRAAISGSGVADTGQPSSLAQLWIQAGGSPALANTMAAIAMAESGGRVDAQGSNTNGTTDNGLWQINSSHSQYSISRLRTDPLYNAQAAVAVEQSQGLKAWTTYTSGAYRQFLNQPDTIKGYGGTRPGGEPAGQKQSGVPQLFNQYLSLRDMPRTAPPNVKNPVQYFMASFTGNWDKLGLPNQ